MEITVLQEGSQARLVLRGSIDEGGAEVLKNSFYKLNLQSTKEVIVDFKEVNYIGSSGIGKILLFYKNLGIHGGTVRVENTPPAIYQLFQELKLHTILTITKA